MERVDEVDPTKRLTLLFPNLIVQALFDPVGAGSTVESILRSRSGEDDRDSIVAAAQLFRAISLGSRRRYDQADRLVREWFRPERCFSNDKACIYQLWLAHLLEREPVPEIVEFGISLAVDDTPYAISAHVAAAMSSAAPRREVGRSVVGVADRMLSGRLQLEEAEVLVAFARLAQLDGDHSRALELANVIAPRSPWAIQVLAEVLCEIEGWGTGDWMSRTATAVVERARPAKLVEIRARAPAVLSQELARW
jgi:hypothetical protein